MDVARVTNQLENNANLLSIDYLLFDLVEFLYLALGLGGRCGGRFASGGVPAVGGDVTASPSDVTSGELSDFTSGHVLLLL